ncbi:MAG: hypothetical protein WB383_00265 [Acidimicrobiales bacterium]
MGFRANGRIKGWTAGLKSWSLRETKLHADGSPEYEYAMGVLMAVMDATYPGPSNQTSDTLAKLPRFQYEGYINARLLIDKVLALGDAPTGTYEELLAQQRQATDEIPAQEVWRRGKGDLDYAMQLLNEDYIAGGPTGTKEVIQARLDLIVGKLNSATSWFDELAKRKANLELVQPLAAACRQIAEGLLNGDGDALHEGRLAVVAIMLPIEEERERRQGAS